jgi:putative tricarboxylic transport membrane protein
MAQAAGQRSVDRVAVAVGLGLLGLAAVTAWDASTLTVTSPYGVGPDAVPYAVAGGLVVLAFGHLLKAVPGAGPKLPPVDGSAIAWIGLGLIWLGAAVGLGGGFIPAVALLFTATARAFGRSAVLTDFAIGLVLGLVIYLGFTKLLALSLPQGPLERLL